MGEAGEKGRAANHSTVGDLLRRFERDVVPTKAPKTQKEYSKMIRQLLGAFDEAPVEDITPSTIAQYRDARTAKVRANRRSPCFPSPTTWPGSGASPAWKTPVAG